MGGDRDGNPFVTPETTRDVVITARLAAINVYFQAIEQLMFETSQLEEQCRDAGDYLSLTYVFTTGSRQSISKHSAIFKWVRKKLMNLHLLIQTDSTTRSTIYIKSYAYSIVGRHHGPNCLYCLDHCEFQCLLVS